MAQLPFHGTAERTAIADHNRQDTQEYDDFDQFFLDCYRSLVRTVMCAGATLQAAEEAVLDAMHVAYKRFAELDKPAAFVRRVALRLFIGRAQRERELRRREIIAADHHPAPRPEDGDLLRFVLAILDTLPTTQRVVMALTIDGYPPRDIAVLIGSSSDTVRSNLRHARSAVIAALTKGEGWHG